MAIKIFISHAAADEVLASALVDCLFSSMVLEDADLRCTSVPGHKLPVGSDFAKTLLEDIGESSVVIGLITKKALASSWVLFELGATWGAKKNLMPLVAGDVSLKDLPGPVSGRHVAQLVNRDDLTQFLEELGKQVGAKSRTAAKIGKAIDTLLRDHEQYVAAQENSSVGKKIETKAKSKEPVFAGVPFSELLDILKKDKVRIPSKLSGREKDSEISLFDLFVGNSTTLADGLQSNWGADTAGGFLYTELGLRLLPYGLVQFEKLPAAQAKYFKRIGMSPEGHKFLLQCKRVTSDKG